MRALTAIRKYRSSIRGPHPAVATRAYSTTASGPRHQNARGSHARWISAVTLGSGLGLLYYSLDPDPKSAFSDWSTVNDRKLSLPDYSDKFLLPGEKEEENDLNTILTRSGYGSRSVVVLMFSVADAFRRKVFFNYEKRIRLRSPPEKVFEYFASHRAPDGELLMRPADLMRAVVPVFPPSDSNLVREGYLRGERRPGDLRCDPSEFFMLFDVNNDGLISFKEYIFFVTLLSIPESSFSVAFKMFDINNNGDIDKEEFKKVMALMRAQNRQGVANRDGLRTGWKVHGHVENGGLVEYFFGKDGQSRLQHDKFVNFLRGLEDEITRLEFAHYNYKSGQAISAKDFALSMVASADISHLSSLLDQVDALDDHDHLKNMRITFDEFRNFAELRKKLRPLSLALFSYGKVNGLLTRDDFKRAAYHVCDVPLTDNVVDIIFHVFDANCDGHLSPDEFLRVLHKRERDIAQPVQSGLMGFLACYFNCASESSLGWLFQL